MSGARAGILSALRAAAPRAQLPNPGPASPSSATGAIDAAVLLDRFVEELRAVDGVPSGPMSTTAAREVCLEIVRDTGTETVLSWSDVAVGLPELTARLEADGCSVDSGDLPADGGERSARLVQLARCGVGVTGALAGIARSGSLVLASGPDRPRLAWLLPRVHVAVLNVGRLQASLDDVRRDRLPVETSANVTIVTGPSRTGDIELTLTRGVHGPEFLNVILVRDDDA